LAVDRLTGYDMTNSCKVESEES